MGMARTIFQLRDVRCAIRRNLAPGYTVRPIRQRSAAHASWMRSHAVVRISLEVA